MKREFIKNLLPDITDDVLKQIMDEHSKDVGTYTAKLSALETERDGYKTQLSEASESIKSYKDMDIDGIKQKAAEWETKYNTDTQALRDKLDAQAYSHAVEGIISGVKFTSQSAKKAFLSDLTQKGLKMDDGKLLGYEDFVNDYKKNDPSAFASDDGGGHIVPTVVSKTTGGGADTASALRAAFGLPDKAKE